VVRLSDDKTQVWRDSLPTMLTPTIKRPTTMRLTTARPNKNQHEGRESDRDVQEKRKNVEAQESEGMEVRR